MAAAEHFPGKYHFVDLTWRRGRGCGETFYESRPVACRKGNWNDVWIWRRRPPAYNFDTGRPVALRACSFHHISSSPLRHPRLGGRWHCQLWLPCHQQGYFFFVGTCHNLQTNAAWEALLFHGRPCPRTAVISQASRKEKSELSESLRRESGMCPQQQVFKASYPSARAFRNLHLAFQTPLTWCLPRQSRLIL